MAGVIKDRSGPQPFQLYFSALPHSLSNLDNGPVASSSDLFAPGCATVLGLRVTPKLMLLSLRSANWEAIWLVRGSLRKVRAARSLSTLCRTCKDLFRSASTPKRQATTRASSSGE